MPFNILQSLIYYKADYNFMLYNRFIWNRITIIYSWFFLQDRNQDCKTGIRINVNVIFLSEIDCLFVSYRVNRDLSDAFGPMEKYCSWPKLLLVESQHIWVITLGAKKRTSKPISSYSFWAINLKLSGYVLGTNANICIGWIYN